MTLYIQPRWTGEAMAPTEILAIQQEVRLMSMSFLIGIFLLLSVYTGFYAFIYKTRDRVKSSGEVQEAGTREQNGHRRWFQPFCNLDDELISTDGWMGTCSTDSDTLSSYSADNESD